MSDPYKPIEPTFEELVTEIRDALADLKATEHELDPPTRKFARDIQAALDLYDEASR